MSESPSQVGKRTGKTTANGVEVLAVFPRTVRITGALPDPETDGDALVWGLDPLPAGEQRTIQVKFVPTVRGQIAADAQVQLRLQAESGVSLRCNSRDLLVIFGNLLDNAIHFAPSGSIVEVESTSDGVSATAEVRDCGPGIPTTESNNLILHAGGIERLGGFGLRAVHNVTARLGGEVKMLSRVGPASGLVVRIILPIR